MSIAEGPAPAALSSGAAGTRPPASGDAVIDLRNVTKVYGGKVQALRGISMHVRRGEVFGLLGPNGAGKSTLVKIMMTVIRPTHVEGEILGRPVGHKPTLGRIGYLPENHRFPRYLSGRQTIEFFAALHKVDRRTRKRRAAELLETVGMAHDADRKTATYSKGMMQRIGLAQALVNDPALVVLDEPTDGVDPVGRRDIRDVIARLRAGGTTVFVNSHLLSELEMICDRVAILVAGLVSRFGTIDELTRKSQRYEIELTIEPGMDVGAAVAAALPGKLDETVAPAVAPVQGRTPAAPPLPVRRGQLRSGTWVELQGPTLRLGTTDPMQVQPVIDALRARALTVRRVQMMRPSLEDLFIETVTDSAGRGPTL